MTIELTVGKLYTFKHGYRTILGTYSNTEYITGELDDLAVEIPADSVLMFLGVKSCTGPFTGCICELCCGVPFGRAGQSLFLFGETRYIVYDCEKRLKEFQIDR